MAFVHRLVIVGFIVVALFAALISAGPSPPGVPNAWLEITLFVGGGFAFLIYLLAWLCRGSLRSQ